MGQIPSGQMLATNEEGRNVHQDLACDFWSHHGIGLQNKKKKKKKRK
jgi:hypothetical protein